MVLSDAEGHAESVCSTVGVTTFTFQELDQLSGAMLYLGRLHQAVAGFLDTTAYRSDTGLIEFLNHAPASMAMELLPATELLLAEVGARVQELRTATSAALDSCAERADEGKVSEVTDDLFAAIMEETFGTEGKKNGL